MKITVEFKDEDAEWLRKTFHIDATNLINSLITAMMEGLKELELANRTKIPRTSENIRKFADEIGRKAWREAKDKGYSEQNEE